MIENRMPTWWHRMDDEIFKAYQMPLQLRHQNAALRRGEFKVLEARDDSQIFIFDADWASNESLLFSIAARRLRYR